MLGNKDQPRIHSISQRLEGAESGIQFSAKHVADLRHAHSRHICKVIQRFSQLATSLLELLEDSHIMLFSKSQVIIYNKT